MPFSQEAKSQNSFCLLILWPPNSPDLTPVDKSVWGILQDKVYKTCMTDLDDLKHRIRTEWAKLDHAVIADGSFGPILFVLYTVDLIALVRSFNCRNAHLYADDTQVYGSWLVLTISCRLILVYSL